jgi:hypothetical protein
MSTNGPLPLRVLGERREQRNGETTLDFQCTLELRVVREDSDDNSACALHFDMEGGHSFFNAIINDKVQSLVRTDSGRKTFSFALPDVHGQQETTVWIVKRTESALIQLIPPLQLCPYTIKTSPITIYGVHAEGCKLVPPQTNEEEDLSQIRKIEFIGDSDTAAFGNEGAPCEISVSSMLFRLHASSQNISNSWAHMLCRMLEAEPSVVAWSGIGVHQNAQFSDPPVAEKGSTMNAMQAVYLRLDASALDASALDAVLYPSSSFLI